MANEGFQASIRCRDVRPNRWVTLGRCEGVGGGRGRSFKGSQSVPAAIFGQWGVAGGGRVVIKRGVSVLRLNEQADKLCEGSRRRGSRGQTLLSLAH